MPKNIGGVIVLAVLCGCAVTGQARAQQQQPEDPEDDKKLGLWLDQGISTGLNRIQPRFKNPAFHAHLRSRREASQRRGTAKRDDREAKSRLTLVPYRMRVLAEE